MVDRLPVRLGNSTLADASFEIRFESNPDTSKILPGMLFSELKCSKIENLPHAEIPAFIRATDPNLKYAAIHRLTWGKFSVFLGDNVFGLAPTKPYPGWAEFSKAIREVLDFLERHQFLSKLERFSLKYSNILRDSSFPNIFDSLNVKFAIGANEVDTETLLMRAEIRSGETINIVQIVGRASANFPDGTQESGILVDTDSIRIIAATTPTKNFAEIRAELDELHEENKALFFGMLTKSGLEKMEPLYE